MNGEHVRDGYGPGHSALFTSLGYGILDTPDDISKWAASGGAATVDECRAALEDGLQKGWFRIHDQRSIAETLAEVRAAGLVGPVYGFDAQPGDVDFTPAGAQLHLREVAEGFARCNTPRRDFPYVCVTEFVIDGYYATAAAEKAKAGILEQWPCTTVSEPVRCGPYKVEWWLTVPRGVRVRFRTTGLDAGTSGGFASAGFRLSDRWDKEPDRLRDVLNTLRLTFVEWSILERLSSFAPHRMEFVIRHTADLSRNRSGQAPSEAECRAALKSCLERGLAQLHGERGEAPTIVEAVGVIDLRHESENHHNADEIDLSPAGAAVFLAVLQQFLGPNWTDDVQAEAEVYRREHRYCRTAECMQSLFEGAAPVRDKPDPPRKAFENWLAYSESYAGKGEKVLSYRIEEIGPWCLHWWERFPSGFRAEVEIGEYPQCDFTRIDREPSPILRPEGRLLTPR